MRGSGASSDFDVCGRGLCPLQPRAFLNCGSGKNVLEMQLIQHGNLAKPMRAPLYIALSQGDFILPSFRSNSWNLTTLKRPAPAAISSLMIKRCAHQDRCICIKLCAWHISCGASSEFLWQLGWNACSRGREAGVVSYYHQVTNVTFLIILKCFLRICQNRRSCETVWAAGCWESWPRRGDSTGCGQQRGAPVDSHPTFTLFLQRVCSPEESGKRVTRRLGRWFSH